MKHCTPKELIGRKYEPIFPYFTDLKKQGGFVVVVDDYVSADSGTGFVHQAPAFGEDDYRVARANKLPFVDPVDKDGKFNSEVSDFAGMNIKQADKAITRWLKEQKSMFKHSTLEHSYPFCWRTDTPLILH